MHTCSCLYFTGKISLPGGICDLEKTESIRKMKNFSFLSFSNANFDVPFGDIPCFTSWRLKQRKWGSFSKVRTLWSRICSQFDTMIHMMWKDLQITDHWNPLPIFECCLIFLSLQILNERRGPDFLQNLFQTTLCIGFCRKAWKSCLIPRHKVYRKVYLMRRTAHHNFKCHSLISISSDAVSQVTQFEYIVIRDLPSSLLLQSVFCMMRRETASPFVYTLSVYSKLESVHQLRNYIVLYTTLFSKNSCFSLFAAWCTERIQLNLIA